MSEREFQTRGNLDVDEAPDLEECVSDPIHRTASIQGHGTFLHVDAEAERILSAAENAPDFLGERLDAIVGGFVEDLFSGASVDWFQNHVDPEGAGALHTGIEVAGTPLAASLFPVGTEAGIELERSAEEIASANKRFMEAHSLFERIRRADDHDALAEAAVRAVRDASGFERVMFYEFDKGGHGSVVAEDRLDELESYLGQNFPASDIPEPARRLYRKNPFRYIPDATAEPVLVHGADGPRERSRLDLTYADLRGVPRVHRQYLANMGVRGSMSVPLVVDDELEALIACHMVTDSAELTWSQRSTCALLGRFISERWAKLRDRRRRERREQVEAVGDEFADDIDNFASFSHAIQQLQEPMLSLMGADRFYFQIRDRQVWLFEEGTDPAGLLLETIRQQLEDRQTVVVDSIVGDVDDSWSHSDEVAGYLATRLGRSDRAFAVWFRPEQRRSIDWGGDPREPTNVDDQGELQPRDSFQSWTQIVEGQCRPWTELDRLTAREIRKLLKSLALETQTLQLQRLNDELEATNERKQQLLERVEQLARTDQLTGLTNRGEFERKLEEEYERARRYDCPLSLLMLDLDHFKSINDAYGHQAGDRVLETLGELLEEETRSSDMPARYGGEEFTVILPQTALDRAADVARRLLEALRRRTFEHEGEAFTVTCSVGASQLADDGPDGMVERADRALYRAKEAGRDGVALAGE